MMRSMNHFGISVRVQTKQKSDRNSDAVLRETDKR